MANKTGSTIRSWVLGNKPFKISQTFAQHRAKGGFSKLYSGIDIATPVGINIYSPDAGVCYNSFTDKDGANIITLKHKSCFTQYAHLLARLVAKGTKIKKGQLIGRTGKSGKVTGPHLHFALIKGTVYDNSKRVDPYAYLLSVSEPKSPQTVVKVVPSATPTIKTSPSEPQSVVLGTSGGGNTVIPPITTSSDTETVKLEEVKGGDVVMAESKQFELNKADVTKSGKNALVFLAPTLLVLLASIAKVIPVEGAYGVVALYIVNILTDLLRKFLEGEK